jgi:hypothetical protein
MWAARERRKVFSATCGTLGNRTRRSVADGCARVPEVLTAAKLGGFVAEFQMHQIKSIQNRKNPKRSRRGNPTSIAHFEPYSSLSTISFGWPSCVLDKIISNSEVRAATETGRR